VSERLNPVALVIIGAGAGTRFGGPKAEATLDDGRRFVDAIADVAKSAGLAPMIAVLPPGVAAPAGVRAVVNSNPKSEQIVSARLGLAQLTNAPVTSALLWPVDHPFVRLESVLAILDAARRTNAHIVVPVHEGRRGHPAWFHRETWRGRRRARGDPRGCVARERGRGRRCRNPSRHRHARRSRLRKLAAPAPSPQQYGTCLVL
jgi:CTP:molybdopterin cytidylyltransferase MocA